jgi:hypothetical protein
LLELYTLHVNTYKEEYIDETNIEDLFIEIREPTEFKEKIQE